MIMHYLYKNFWHLYDWFYKADDDTFAIFDNLRYILTGYSTDDPIFIGYKFHTPLHRWAYCIGGGGISHFHSQLIVLLNHFSYQFVCVCTGYAISKTTLRTFVEKLLINEMLCPQNRSFRNLSEDWNIPMCLVKLNVFLVDTRDWVKRERFLILKGIYFQCPKNGIGCDSNIGTVKV